MSWENICVWIVPRFLLNGRGPEMPPTGHVRADNDPTLPGQRRRAGRGTRSRGTAYAPRLGPKVQAGWPRSVLPPTGHIRAGTDLTLHGQRRRAVRRARCRWTAYASCACRCQAGRTPGSRVSYWSCSRRRRSFTTWAASARGSEEHWAEGRRMHRNRAEFRRVVHSSTRASP